MRLCFAIAVLLSVPATATAQTLLGGLWTLIDPPPPPPEIRETLSSIRSQGCVGATDPNANAFAETGFGRGELDRDFVPEDVQSTLTAIFAAETHETAERLAETYLDDPNQNVAASVRIALAYSLLRNRPVGQSQHVAVARLLSQPEAINNLSDTHYIRAALALERRSYKAAGRHAGLALKTSPQFYNARVVQALARLASVPDAIGGGQCNLALELVTEAVRPLFEGGACKLHIGHFQLAADRYLPHPSDAPSQEARTITTMVLAFISGKDETFRTVRAASTPIRCEAALDAALGGP